MLDGCQVNVQRILAWGRWDVKMRHIPPGLLTPSERRYLMLTTVPLRATPAMIAPAPHWNSLGLENSWLL